jgi:hypothetical protein
LAQGIDVCVWLTKSMSEMERERRMGLVNTRVPTHTATLARRGLGAVVKGRS